MTTSHSELWDSTYRASAAGARWWPNEELVRSVSGMGRRENVLEVGCGVGGNLWFLAEHADHVTGIDISEEALTLCAEHMVRRRAMRNVGFSRSDVLSLPYGREFDFIVDSMVSQHIPWADHPKAYAEYRRVLSDNGRLFLYHLDNWTSADSAPIAHRDYEGLMLFPKVGLICLPTLDELEKALESAGFTVLTHRRVMKTYTNGLTASYAVIEALAA